MCSRETPNYCGTIRQHTNHHVRADHDQKADPHNVTTTTSSKEQQIKCPAQVERHPCCHCDKPDFLCFSSILKPDLPPLPARLLFLLSSSYPPAQSHTIPLDSRTPVSLAAQPEPAFADQRPALFTRYLPGRSRHRLSLLLSLARRYSYFTSLLARVICVASGSLCDLQDLQEHSLPKGLSQDSVLCFDVIPKDIHQDSHLDLAQCATRIFEQPLYQDTIKHDCSSSAKD